MTDAFETITYDVADHIATITLNRPDKMNAFTWTMGAEYRKALIASDENDDVRVTIVTGAGKAFCAGADLSGGKETFTGGPDARSMQKGAMAQPKRKWSQNLVDVMFHLRKPVIVAYNGAAVGVGVTMTLPADIRIASEKAKLGIVFVRRGIVPEVSCPWLLPRLIGVSRAAELMYTGRILTAPEALEWGLVSHVVPPDQLLPKAREIASEIAVHAAPVSVAITKRMMMEFLVNPPNSIMDIDNINSRYFAWTGQQADAREGVMSFLQKRDPEWKLSVNDDMPEFFEQKK